MKDANGDVTELRCTWDPESRGGNPKDGRKIKGTIHWVSAETAIDAEVRLYDRLFLSEQPGEGDRDFLTEMNPHSCEVLAHAKLEPSLAKLAVGESVQLERVGYFCVDPDTTPAKLVMNRTIGLRDSWTAKQK